MDLGSSKKDLCDTSGIKMYYGPVKHMDYIGEGRSNSSGVTFKEQHFPVLILIASKKSDYNKLKSRHVPSTLNELVT